MNSVFTLYYQYFELQQKQPQNILVLICLVYYSSPHQTNRVSSQVGVGIVFKIDRFGIFQNS